MSRPVNVAVTLSVVLSCIQAWATIAGRWGAMVPAVAAFGTCIVAGAACLGFVIGGLTSGVLSERRTGFGFSLAVFAGSFLAVSLVSRFIASSQRQADVMNALASGLVDDCKTVRDAFTNDPRFERKGYVRVFPGTPEYEALPASVREFEPVYVTIEGSPFHRPNVGLCKNGFGGFHMGVRVFQCDPKIPHSYARNRVTPVVYVWTDET